MIKSACRWASLLLIAISSLSTQSTVASERRPLTITDIMKFHHIEEVQLSDDGQWLAYSAVPDRGDATGFVQSTQNDQRYTVPRGRAAEFDDRGHWVAFTVKQPLLAIEKASKKARQQLKDALSLVDLNTGKTLSFDRVESYQLHDSGHWLAVRFFPPLEEKIANGASENNRGAGPDQQETDSQTLYNKSSYHHQLLLVDLRDDSRQTFDNVAEYAFANDGHWLSYAVSSKQGEDNKLVVIDLTSGKGQVLNATTAASYSQLAWNEQGSRLAYLQGDYAQKSAQRPSALLQWRPAKQPQAIDVTQQGWWLPTDNELRWSDNGQRLFFGLKPVAEAPAELDVSIESEADLFDIAKLQAGKGVQIWHGEDPLIKPNEAKIYDEEQKRYYQAVYEVNSNQVVRLADELVRDIEVTDHPKALLATTDVPYLRQRSWAGFFEDVYVVDLKTGIKSLVVERIDSDFAVELSPSGRYTAYYNQGHIWLYDKQTQQRSNLSQGLKVSFANEDHDYPRAAEGYGIAGWLSNDTEFLVYDKYDIWLFNTRGKAPRLLTDGRDLKRQLRIVNTDEQQLWFEPDQTLLLKSYNHQLKNHGFYQLALSANKLTKLVEQNKKYSFIAKAKNARTLVYSREDFNEFPDLWVSQSTPDLGRKVTDVNPQKKQLLWGSPELVAWHSADGKPHQGVLIKPANYQPGQRYPVLVYYYRLFSQRMYEFNPMKVNHRPNFPYYTSNGYAVFLPDVHFSVGTPGRATAKSIVPGVQKLIDMGIADPDAIGLHGHSWSGYQTAFTITETDIFKAAVAGAPVTNMTSAYSGIRLKSGLARQFQYETGQSRIGASLWQQRHRYIENSPVFYADRINTPLLMQFGDSDGAVPWQQGIEMYLAMRRLDKPVIFLQYEGEPHHLKKYPNKVDYTLKMKAFFDHHLKGAPAPVWMTRGAPYRETSEDAGH